MPQTFKPPRSRFARTLCWLGYALPLVSIAALLLTAYWWRRSHQVIDQWISYTVHVDPTPLNTPPTIGDSFRERRYPAGTISYMGTFNTYMADNFPGRLLLRHMWVSSTYPKPEPTPEIAAILGFKRDSMPVQDLITYNLPRGNVYITSDDWHWNGLATWGTYMDGESGRYVMLPYWLLAMLAAAPGLGWGGLVALASLRRRRRRVRGRCVRCNYNRGGLPPTQPCPECGLSAPAIGA